MFKLNNLQRAAAHLRRPRAPNLSGQGLVEYALILVLVAVVVIVVAALLGDQIQNIYCDIVITLGDGAPTVPACEAPRVTCSGLGNGATVTGPINVEALVKDNKGTDVSNILRVRFYIDGTLRQTEFRPRYCLGTGGRHVVWRIVRRASRPATIPSRPRLMMPMVTPASVRSRSTYPER